MASTWLSIIWMAKRSNSFAPARLSPAIGLTCVGLLIACVVRESAACPFCTVLAPTLCQLRELAVVVALAEVESPPAARPSRLRLHRVLAGADRLTAKNFLEITLPSAAGPGSLLLIFGTGGAAAGASELTWSAVAMNEASYAYFARAPSLKIPAAERLRYFAPFLEHREALVAEDAYLEFGHAPFDQVARVAELLPMDRLRAWLRDPRVRPERKGFYGLALGLGTAGNERNTNAEFLRQLILAPEDDFRAGFDGILGGYLLLSASKGLELVEGRYLANPRAADGDVRHAMTALRFYHEFGHEIPPDRLQQAMRQVLVRSEFAAAAITDLARWKDWGALAQIVDLYSRAGYGQPAIRCAIVGYLLACPETAAAKALARLRQLDPEGITAAEQMLSRASGVPAGQE
jgi:hypothetical protein